MKYSPKQIIFIAIANYLTNDQVNEIKTELVKQKYVSPYILIKTLGKHFHYTTLRDNPIIPEDIWLFNYLYYECNLNKSILNSSETLNIVGKLKKTPLLNKYAKQIIMPQLKALEDANMILNNLQ